MELRHLRYFVTVVEAGTVSGAAERLRLTQPALSRQIRDLEAELGIALFERVGRSLRLTGAGEDLMARARQVLNDADAFRDRARSLRRGDVGVLRVGATPQTLERLFPAVLARFRAVLPGVEVRLSENDSAALLSLLRGGGLHLAVAAYRPEWHAASRVLGVIPLLAVSGGPPSPASGTVEVRALAGEPLLLLRRGFGSRDLFDAACHLAHVRPTVFLESGAPATLLALARAGCGTAILPATVGLGEAGCVIRQVVQEGTPLELRFAVHWNPQRFLPPYAERFADELARQVREEYARTAAPWSMRFTAP